MSDTAPTTRLIRPLRGGQITIPAEFRRRLGITEDTMLQVCLTEGELHIKPVRLSETPEQPVWLRELYAYFEPVRQEMLDRKIPEEEINADIDAAIAAAREQRRTGQP